jgi:hypothetical protein
LAKVAALAPKRSGGVVALLHWYCTIIAVVVLAETRLGRGV